MGWFEEQIRQRAESDQEILEDSFFRMASIVMDKWNAERSQGGNPGTREALDDILKYYRQKPAEIPENITEFTDQMEYALRPSGLMVRDVELDEGWQNDAFGPMLGRMKDDGPLMALLPGKISGYYYRDPATGKRVRVNRKTAGLFEREAVCFYHPLPMKKLNIADLLWYMKSCISHGDLFLIIAATLAVTLVGMIEPRLYQMLTGPILQGRRMNVMGGVMIFLLTAAFSSQLLGVVRDLLMQRISIKTSQAVEASTMMRLLSLPISFFRRYSSGELASRANSISTLCDTMLSNILSIGLSSLLSLVYIGQIFSFAPALTVPSVLIILGTVVMSAASSLVQIGISRKRMKESARQEGMTYATLGGIQKIRLSGSEKRVFARWGQQYAKTASLEYNPPVFLKVNKVLTLAIGLAGTVILYYLALESGVGESEYFAFSAAYGRVSGAFQSLAGITISMAAIPPILEMAAPILQAEPEVSSEKEAVTRINGNIEMSHVSFRYEENMPYILRDLSLKIRAGEYIAIVGRTGCGKSTLIRLLLGFEKPESGSVFYDHYDLARIDPRSLRKRIGVVIQNGQLFQGDIFSNITISAPELTLAEAWEAAETAGIADDIREMPMGMNTMISEGQGGISGGQKQRLMIARAVAPKPRILIFDEATSALDNITQKKVSDALDKLQCTRIVIAHRLSTVQHCDRILVMDNGAIIEEGSYDELIRKNGVFADLVARQRVDTDDAAE